MLDECEVSPSPRKDGLRKINAQLRYYFHVPDPDALSDEEWAMRFNELVWLRKEEAEN